MNKRIAIIGTRGYPSYYGGFETAVRQLAPYLADQKWDVTVYGRHGSTSEKPIDVDPRIRRVVTKGLESKSLSTLSYGLTSALHAVKDRPDAVLIMNCANGYWLPFLKLRGIPTAVNVDGMEWEREKWGRIAKTVFKCGARLTARFADVIIADAREIARHWSIDFGRDSVFIPYGGDFPESLPSTPEYSDQKYILVVARFVPENSIPQFFDAVKLLNGKYPVVIVGSGGYGGTLDKAAQLLTEQYENVHWLGHVSNDRQLHALWQHAGAYFHGHSVGGTNPALVQAMACGAPVVARDTPYNREVLAHTGTFVSASPSDIANALANKVEDVMAGRFDSAPVVERARNSYTWDLVCRGYAKVLADLVTP